ncbi:hypothetical protein FB99_18680 [Pantoea agglomerans]|nr:hypothetical protein FB99_18680 [Pantoea agglomerans]
MEQEVPEGDASKVVTSGNQNSDRLDKMKRCFIFVGMLF